LAGRKRETIGRQKRWKRTFQRLEFRDLVSARNNVSHDLRERIVEIVTSLIVDTRQHFGMKKTFHLRDVLRAYGRDPRLHERGADRGVGVGGHCEARKKHGYRTSAEEIPHKRKNRPQAPFALL
jgi:hypothetical protein